jgi:hypothetical protein
MEYVDPNSDEQEIITRLRNLRTKSARHRVFHELIHQLASDEWRDLRDRLNTRTFQCDILGLLPPEIAVQVAQYLDLAEIHVFQRVGNKCQRLVTMNGETHIIRSLELGTSYCHQARSAALCTAGIQAAPSIYVIRHLLTSTTSMPSRGSDWSEENHLQPFVGASPAILAQHV